MTATAPCRPRELERPAPGQEGIRESARHAGSTVRRGPRGPLPAIAREFEDSVAIRVRPEDGEGLEHQLGPLVGQDRADEDVLPAREAGQEVADAGEVVRAVPDLERLLAPRLEPARQRDVLAPRAGRPRRRGTPPPPATASARLLLPATIDVGRRRSRARAPPTRDRRARRCSRAARPRASRRRSPRACRRARPCDRARRS